MNPVRKRIWLFCAMVILVVFAVYRAGGQSPAAANDPFAAADEKILAEIHDHSEAMANLEYLSDIIGPRLTGSERTKRPTSGRQKCSVSTAWPTCISNPGRSRTPGHAARRTRAW